MKTYTVQMATPGGDWADVGLLLRHVRLERASGALDLASYLYPCAGTRIVRDSDGAVIESVGRTGQPGPVGKETV